MKKTRVIEQEQLMLEYYDFFGGGPLDLEWGRRSEDGEYNPTEDEI